jgi:hypothetical protein
MMKQLIFIFVFSIAVISASAQGCSDAGFCSISGIKTAESQSYDDRQITHLLKSGVAFGVTNPGISVVVPYAEYVGQLSPDFGVSVKVFGGLRMGDITSTAGLSDAILTAQYVVLNNTRLILGGKIPLNRANKQLNGTDLPMSYQTSLGTYDLIVGLQQTYGNFIVAAAWQQPFVQNLNSFTLQNRPAVWGNEFYYETNGYNRSGDILVRLSYRHHPKAEASRWSFVYSILPIYHLQNDTYLDSENKRVEHVNSKGLTLNVNAFASYSLSQSSWFEFSAGFPVVARSVRPDGLSTFSVGIEYVVRF